MCLFVNYSEKSVKSDYLGVIICNWWRRVRKIGIFAAQNAKYTENSYEDPKKLGFLPKLHSLSVLHAEYTENSDIRCDFSKKLGNSQQLSVQLTSKLTILVENSEKLKFSANANEFSKINICKFICGTVRVQK